MSAAEGRNMQRRVSERIGRIGPAPAAVLAAALMLGLVGCLPSPPVVSPDGRWVALCLSPTGDFTLDPDDLRNSAYRGARDLYLARSDGSQVRRITDLSNPAADRLISVAHPSFSRTGEFIAFSTREIRNDTRVSRLFVIPNIPGRATMSHSDLARFEVARATGADIVFPALSPSGLRLAWVETEFDPFMPARPTAEQRRDPNFAVNAGFHGRLRMVGFGLRGWYDIALPDAVATDVIPQPAWIGEHAIVVAQRNGDGPHMLTSAVTWHRIDVVPDRPLLAWEERYWTAGEQVIAQPLGDDWGSSYIIQAAGDPDRGGFVYDRVTPAARPRTGEIVHLRWGPQQAPGGKPVVALDRRVIAAGGGRGYHTGPRYTTDGSALIWSAEIISDDRTRFALVRRECPVLDDGTLGPAANASEPWLISAGLPRHPLDMLGMAPGGGAMMLWVPRSGDPAGWERPDGAYGQYLGRPMFTNLDDAGEPTATRAVPWMTQLTPVIGRDAPEKLHLIAAARRVLGLAGREVRDYALVYDMIVKDTDSDGQVTEKAGRYREFGRGEMVRKEETYAGDRVVTWDGEQVGRKVGSEEFTREDPSRRRNFAAREIAQELAKVRRNSRLFLLQDVERPTGTETAFIDDFDLSVLGVRERGGRRFVELRRRATWNRPFTGRTAEEVVIVLEMRGDGSVAPFEVRGSSVWRIGEETRGESGVIRFGGEFANLRGIRVPKSFKAYRRLGADGEPDDEMLSATLVLEERDYPYRDGALRPGINTGLGSGLFAGLRW
jgi:hypothetical protein